MFKINETFMVDDGILDNSS